MPLLISPFLSLIPRDVIFHQIMEATAYLVAGRLYWKSSAKFPAPAGTDRLLLLGAALIGGLAGSRALHILEHWNALIGAGDWQLWLGGKTVLGGLMGGTLGVEIAKRYIGWAESTGDAWVLPIAAGLMIGRIGCQGSGPWDQTYGTPTNLPWAWDYGDGIGRHPAAAYEILWVFASLLAARLPIFRSRQGASFACFLLLYCVGRLGLEFFKPPYGPIIPGTLPTTTFAYLTPIQWASIIGLPWFSALLYKRLQSRFPEIILSSGAKSKRIPDA